MKAIDKLKEVTKFFNGSNIESAEKEAEFLIRHSSGINTVEMYRDNPALEEGQIDDISRLISRRALREPLQYIIGYVEFLSLRIAVGEGVLIPRPETEFMAEQAVKRFTIHGSRFTVLDLCTGSGCLALALAKEFPDSQIYGIDISDAAIGYAKKNAEINSTENAIFLRGDLFGPLSPEAPGQLFDFIISNPPYIRTNDIKSLQPEIREWEPLNALDGGPDGLNFYRKIIPQARHFLKDNGVLMLELGAGYMHEVTGMLEYAGYTQIEGIKDYTGIERIVIAQNSTEF